MMIQSKMGLCSEAMGYLKASLRPPHNLVLRSTSKKL
jgi:hypothetical protein